MDALPITSPITDLACAFCSARPQYRDRRTGQYLCLEHARLEVVAMERRAPAPTLTIRCAVPEDRDRIEQLALYFWDETVVDCFDRQYDVLTCPAYLVGDGREIVGLASYTVEPEWSALVLVILNVLPGWQGRGAGRKLLDALRDEAMRRGLRRLLVATSNDDLPALTLYQRYGFHLTEVLPGRIAEEHGGQFRGFAGILVCDEMRLEYDLAGKNSW